VRTRLQQTEWFAVIAGLAALAFAVVTAVAGRQGAAVTFAVLALFLGYMTVSRIRQRQRGGDSSALSVIVTGVLFTGGGLWFLVTAATRLIDGRQVLSSLAVLACGIYLFLRGTLALIGSSSGLEARRHKGSEP
jgi:hypothetical protein